MHILGSEGRHDRAVGAQHVAEPHGLELRDALGRTVERLGVDLRDALGSAHDGGRVDGLVRRDGDELVGIVTAGGVGHVLGAQDVVLDGEAEIIISGETRLTLKVVKWS